MQRALLESRVAIPFVTRERRGGGGGGGVRHRKRRASATNERTCALPLLQTLISRADTDRAFYSEVVDPH